MKKSREHQKGKKKKCRKKEKIGDYSVEISKMKNDVKAFIEKFKSSVNNKRRGYQLYSQKFKKKEKP